MIKLAEPLRLDLGAGDVSPDGFMPVGNHHGSGIFPLPHADGTVDEIRASHVLEHFPRAQIAAVLADWVRALRPGGRLRIAVPDFAEIARRYLAGERLEVQSYVMGAQVAPDDFHHALFDAEELRRQMAASGLVLLRPWASEINDCAALPVSLNLEGRKPHAAEIRVAACMSVPRLGFMDNFFCAFEALGGLGITLHRHTGAFWGACLTRTIEQVLEREAPDAILTLDYDTVFRRIDVATLLQLALVYPEAHAIAALQSSRHDAPPMFTRRGVAPDGATINEATIAAAALAQDLTPAATAHFGLTLLRADRVRALPKPWFSAVPDPDGGWGEGRTDEDIAFWRGWEAAGNTLCVAPRVVVGHAELMIRWPGRDLQAVHQSMTAFRDRGPPDDVWR